MGGYRDSVRKSLPREKKIRGYWVRRMPMGQFLRAMERLQEAPGELMEQLLPGKGDMPFFSALKTLDAEAVKRLVMKAAGILPEYAVRLFAEVSGIEEEKLLCDPAVGPEGFMEMLEAFWEVNGLGNFISGAARMAQGIRGFVKNAGSKD